MKAKKHFSKLLLAASVLLVWAAPAFAQLDSPHDPTGGGFGAMDCSDCHGMHTASAARPANVTSTLLLYRWADQETVCTNCHWASGIAAGLANNFAIHETAAAANDLADCGGCHNPHVTSDISVVGGDPAGSLHGQADPYTNNYWIRRDTGKYVGAEYDIDTVTAGIQGVTATEPALYVATEFAYAAAPANGICQTCHDAASNTGVNANGYWLNDGTGTGHNTGSDCTTCHAHDAGFRPGTCVSCHSAAQDNGDGTPVGGRRAIVAEFPQALGLTGHMAATGAGAGAVVADADCEICHDQSSHADGTVNFKDPDVAAEFAGAAYVRMSDFAKGDANDISDFCLACHDAGGAARLGAAAADPFGSGNAPADITAKFGGTELYTESYGDAACFGTEGSGREVNTHHDVLAGDQTANKGRIECLNCHGAHSPSSAQARGNPNDNTENWAAVEAAEATITAGTDSDNEFCLTCHWGGTDDAAPMLPTDTKTYASTTPLALGAVALRGLESCNYNVTPYWVSYTWNGASHGRDTKRDWADYSAAAAIELRCNDCHDSHGSEGAGAEDGNLYMIKNTILGATDLPANIDDGYRLDPTFPNLTNASDQAVDLNQGGGNPNWDAVCSACHSTVATLATFDWWHGTCSGCMSCHSHGYDFQNNDWSIVPTAGNTDIGCALCGDGTTDGPAETCDTGAGVGSEASNDGDGCNAGCNTTGSWWIATP